MTTTDKTGAAHTDSISFELDLHHPPEKVWRALTDPELLAQWLLHVVDRKLDLAPGAAFTLKTQPYPGWDGTVSCRMLEIDAHRKLSYAWTVPFPGHRRDVHTHAHGDVVGVRMKRAGARFAHHGGQTVLTFRAALLSGRLDTTMREIVAQYQAEVIAA